MRFRRSSLLILALTVAYGAGARAQNQPLTYPVTSKGEVVDEHFGERLPDPYRWLESLDSPETARWIADQNAITNRYLQTLPFRETIRQRITELWNYPKVTIPFREGGRLFYRRNSGLQRQSVLYMLNTLASPPRLVIDPNALSPDGSVALMQYAPSPDGRLVAYSLSEGGADWQTVYVRDLRTGRDLTDTVRWMRFSGVSWTKDGKGFFYSRYPTPPPGKVLEAALTGHTLYYHRVGTPQSSDKLIYERKDLPSWIIGGYVPEDGRHLVIFFRRGADPRNRLYFADLGAPLRPNIDAPIRPLIEADDAEYAMFANVGPVFYIRTDLDAPNRKIIAVDTRDPDPAKWRTIIPEAKQALEDMAMAAGRIAARYLVDVKSEIKLFDLAGRPLTTIPLPGVGTVGGISARSDSPEIFYNFTSPLYPTTVFSYNAATRRSTPFGAARPKFDPAAYETKQLFATSKDGTRVPYFVTARKGLPMDGSSPALLYGYGGFAISQTPGYRPDLPAWLEMGGVWATANMRGGGEYGEEWHKAGMLDRKQNVFDDFIAVAEDLVKRGYTASSRLAIQGGSNGGLLVGAAMTQRPELFGVALPAVGVLDMLRYDKFTGGALWVSEYGSPADSVAFRYLRAYSPLHNLKQGTCYPATLVTTADHDDRVVPSHSYKFTAALQAVQSCERPILIRVETQSSHGYRPTDKRIAELADQWAFTVANTGVQPAGVKP